jgi:hypothetical protein
VKIYTPYLQFIQEVSLRFDEEAKSMQDGIGEVSSMMQLGDFIHEQLKSKACTVCLNAELSS